eukprot:62109-Lingulodinium_polyedra.AAC.1
MVLSCASPRRRLEMLRPWLYHELPAWAAMPVLGAVPYLGVYMGPAAGSLVWRSAAFNWTERPRATLASGAPPPTA